MWVLTLLKPWVKGKHMELLTVVLLTYNHEKTIARAFDSILEQKTNFDFDIYVLEDCSTDYTAEICREYKEKHPDKIKLFLNEKNLGVTENFKQGLLKIRSKYFAFLEGDDYWCDENKLQKQVDALEQNSDCTLCGHNTLCNDTRNHKKYLRVKGPGQKIRTKYTVKDNFAVHPSSRVYRNIIDLTDVPLCMVLDSNIYLLYLTKGNLFYIDKVMSVYNMTHTGFWAGRTRKQRKLYALKVKSEVNKFFNFAYEYKYYRHSKLLKVLKSIFHVRLGWLLFYFFERLRLELRYLGHE
jgi:glycosyltransferase involved in cell wall biosynthesis